MAYWWASQGDNWRVVIDAGTLWAGVYPDGSAPADWKVLEELAVGDTVFHYGGQAIRAVSRVVEVPVWSPRPAVGYRKKSPGQPDAGWLVRVEPTHRGLNLPSSQATQIVAHGTPGPIDRTGRPGRRFVSRLSDEDGQELLAALGISAQDDTNGAPALHLATQPQGQVATWIFPSNDQTFDASGALRDLGEVSWSQRNDHQVGDIVYLYASRPVQAITVKCVVTAVDQEYANSEEERRFWRDKAALAEREGRARWMRLSAVSFFEGNKDGPLGIQALREHGHANFNGRSRPSAPLLSYLRQFDDVTPDGDDAAAESSEVDAHQVAVLRSRAARGDYAVPDREVTAKTRGSAQRVFAEAVKANYGYECAVTGIRTRAFLVASHIVPWSVDETIRTDPRNGICLSTLIDRAFDTDYLRIDTDLTVRVNWAKIDDPALRDYLAPYDRTRLRSTIGPAPDPDYLTRRLANPPH